MGSSPTIYDLTVFVLKLRSVYLDGNLLKYASNSKLLAHHSVMIYLKGSDTVIWYTVYRPHDDINGLIKNSFVHLL